MTEIINHNEVDKYIQNVQKLIDSSQIAISSEHDKMVVGTCMKTCLHWLHCHSAALPCSCLLCCLNACQILTAVKLPNLDLLETAHRARYLEFC